MTFFQFDQTFRCSTWPEFEWSYCCLARVDLVFWNLPKSFQFMETFLTSPNLNEVVPICSNFIKVVQIYPYDYDFIQI